MKLPAIPEQLYKRVNDILQAVARGSDHEISSLCAAGIFKLSDPPILIEAVALNVTRFGAAPSSQKQDDIHPVGPAASNHSATLPINRRPAQEKTRGPCVAGSSHLRNARKDLQFKIGTPGARKPPLGFWWPEVASYEPTSQERCHCDFLLRLANPPTSLSMRSISRGPNPCRTLHQTPIALFGSRPRPAAAACCTGGPERSPDVDKKASAPLLIPPV